MRIEENQGSNVALSGGQNGHAQPSKSGPTAEQILVQQREKAKKDAELKAKDDEKKKQRRLAAAASDAEGFLDSAETDPAAAEGRAERESKSSEPKTEPKPPQR